MRSLLRPAILVGSLWVAGCAAPDAASGFGGAPVLLITIDTVRADHLSLYGYRRSTSPFLEELAREALVFERAFAQGSWTLPSMLSLFSSLEPPALGVHDGVRPASRGRGKKDGLEDLVEVERFSDEHQTLVEALQQSGYRTEGISTNGHLIERQGFSQGFDHFDQESCMWGDASCALGAALELLEEAPREQHFLWVHLFDPHFDRAGSPPEYLPPESHARLFAEEPSHDEREQVGLAYDRKLRAMDDELRAFFSTLSRIRDAGSFLVVIVADHGEEFLEKGRWGHSRAVTNTLTHVPLLIRLPGGALGGQRFEVPVRLLDVAPTVLDFLELSSPSGFRGASLATALRGGSVPVRPAYGETRRSGQSKHYWLDVERDRKLVVDLERGTRELYRFSEDPGELEDIAAAEPRLAAELEALLLELLETLELEPGAQPQPLDQATRDRLQALGYL